MALEADGLGKRSECEACLSMEGPFSTDIAGDAVAGDVEQRGSGDDAVAVFRTAQAQPAALDFRVEWLGTWTCSKTTFCAIRKMVRSRAIAGSLAT
jgi:hypothetical protein